jgi:hypothetical protein
MKLLIKFPTRGRPNKFLETLTRYIDYLDDKSTQIIVTCDNDDESMKQEDIQSYLVSQENVGVFFGNSKTKIEAVNANLENADFDILLLASDDMIPIVTGYDTIIKEKMSEYYPDTDGVLFFNDGYQKDRLNTLCILGKKYYDRFGYVYYPQYKSCYCDNEFMDVSNMLGKQTYFDQVIIQHQHPDWGFGVNDTIHTLNNINGNYDRGLYFHRKQNRFFNENN